MNTTLSICIPTYNRCRLLMECLNSLLPQVLPHQIPIYVSVNPSGDSTVGELDRFRSEKYPLLFYRVNAENVGFDQNLINVASMAQTRYFWLFGDDDRAAPGGVCRVLSAVTDKDYKLVLADYSQWDHEFKIMRRASTFHPPVSASPGPNYLTNKEFIWFAVFISALVIRNDEWRKIDPQKYCGTNNLHVGVILEMMFKDSAYLVSGVCVENRGPRNTAPMPHHFEGWCSNLGRVFEALPESFSPESRTELHDIILSRVLHPRQLLRLRLTNNYNYVHFRRYVRSHYQGRPGLIFLSAAISVLPVRVALLIRQLYEAGSKLRHVFTPSPGS